MKRDINQYNNNTKTLKQDVVYSFTSSCVRLYLIIFACSDGANLLMLTKVMLTLIEGFTGIWS